jgi:hypothetical protein
VRNRDVNRDHPRARRPFRPSTIPQRLWVGGVKSRPAHLRFFSKKNESDLDQKLRAAAWWH